MWSDSHSFNVSRVPTARLKPSSQPGSLLATLLLSAKNRRIFNRMVTKFSIARGCKDYQATM